MNIASLAHNYVREHPWLVKGMLIGTGIVTGITSVAWLATGCNKEEYNPPPSSEQEEEEEIVDSPTQLGN